MIAAPAARVPRRAHGTISYDADAMLVAMIWRQAQRLYLQARRSQGESLVMAQWRWDSIGLEQRLSWYEHASIALGVS